MLGMTNAPSYVCRSEQKRKAQNRASQRAFRERKQSYVATLEEKIDEFEKRGVEVSAELQKVARRLKEENDVLRRENGKLLAKVQALETASHRSREGADEVQGEVKSKLRAKISVLSAPARKGVGTATPVEDHVKASGSVWTLSTAASEEPSGSKNIASMDRDCGFCTDQSPCVCSGEAVLDLTGGDGSEVAMSNSSTTPVKQEEEPAKASPPVSSDTQSRGKLWYTISDTAPPRPLPPVQICPTTNDRRARLPFRLGNSSNVLPPLQITSRGQPKLWPVYSPVPQSFSDKSSSRNVSQGDTVPVYRLSRGRDGGAPGSTAVCSGDPSQCNACSTDPALAAFCRAVASHLSPGANGQPTTPAILDAGNAMPLRRTRKRTHSSTFGGGALPRLSSSSHRADLAAALYTNSRQASGIRSTDSTASHLQSIPEAWKRIKQHPSFPQWQGGLDMLADVVSKRSAEGQRGDTEDAPDRIPRVDIAKKPSISMKFPRKSNDRSVVVDPSAPGSPPTGPHPSSSRPTITVTGSDSASSDAHTEDRDKKRRRLYVERQSVEDALALLDRGHKSKDGSCVCPLNRSI
jgi:hypothetical protein